MQLLKLSTAATVVVGPVLDADGVAVTTAVAADFSIAKNGSVAAFSSETITHSTNGYYTIGLTSSNTNTLGRLDILVNNSAMAMSNHRYDILNANTYDAVITNGVATLSQATNIQADTDDIQSRLPAALVGGRMNSDVGNIQTNAVNASALATDAVQEIQASTLAPNAFTTLQRTIEDTKAITFSWPVSGATITGQKSIDNGAYSAVSGAIAFLRTESNRHYYTLAYNAADRLTVEGTIRYKMTDGTYTKYFNLHVYDVTNAVTVYPLSGNAPDTIEGTTIKTFLESKATIGPISVFDTNNDPVNLSGVLEIIISKKWRGDILVIPNASITRSGVDNNQFSFSVNGATSIPGEHTWAIKRVSDNDPLMFGDFIVQQVANKD